MLPTNRPPTHPGEMLLKEFLEPLGVSQVEAAKRMNIPFQRLNAIVKGRRGVSADTALLFEALTRWDAQIWLTFQAKWDLWHAMRARGQRPKVRALPKPRSRQRASKQQDRPCVAHRPNASLRSVRAAGRKGVARHTGTGDGHPFDVGTSIRSIVEKPQAR